MTITKNKEQTKHQHNARTKNNNMRAHKKPTNKQLAQEKPNPAHHHRNHPAPTYHATRPPTHPPPSSPAPSPWESNITISIVWSCGNKGRK